MINEIELNEICTRYEKRIRELEDKLEKIKREESLDIIASKPSDGWSLQELETLKALEKAE